MPSYTIKVHNNDEGEDLGTYEANYLPRVGDPLVLWHPRVCPKKDEPFCGIVSGVTHEAFNNSHPYFDGRDNVVDTVVWVIEEQAAPTLYCVCSEEQRARWNREADGRCEGCGHVRRV
jgi:hypothetical protein